MLVYSVYYAETTLLKKEKKNVSGFHWIIKSYVSLGCEKVVGWSLLDQGQTQSFIIFFCFSTLENMYLPIKSLRMNIWIYNVAHYVFPLAHHLLNESYVTFG